jgi:CheY-like chemotaxis protein
LINYSKRGYDISLIMPFAEANRVSYILLIEDNDIHAQMLSRILQSAGYSIKRAARGSEGIEMATEETPSLMLVDFGLPEMNGPTTIRNLREKLGDKMPPAIALTAYSDYETKQEATAVGCAAFVTKPYIPNEIIDMVKSIFKTMQSDQQH